MVTTLRIVVLTLTLTLLAGLPAQAASDYPKSAISLVVPASAGGGTDLTARMFAKYAKEFLGQPLVVVNVSGGGGFNGSKRVHDAAPDGYTVLFFHNNGLVLNKLAGIAPYSVEGFETGPRTTADTATGLFVNAASPWKTIHDFIAAAKAKPNGINIASEVGSYTYYLILALQEKLGIKLKVVDAGANSEKTTALLGGHIDSMANSYATNQSYVKAGNFICLGFVSKDRSTVFPEVPTIMEQGVDYSHPGYEIGIFFPLKTPKEIIAKFDAVAKKVSEHPDYQAELKKIGYINKYMPSVDNHKDLLEMEAMYKKLADSMKK